MQAQTGKLLREARAQRRPKRKPSTNQPLPEDEKDNVENFQNGRIEYVAEGGIVSINPV